MSSSANFDSAHRHFSAECFNATWELIEKENRTEDDDRLMIDLAHASVWHWRRRSDCKLANLAIGYWQLARVYALVKEANLARSYGQKVLELTGELDFFNRAFAHEAIARAEMVAGNAGAMNQHLEAARELAGRIADEGDAAWLRKNLGTIA
jgi:hypothetical protein